MIAYIKGELVILEEDRVIVDVGGVGYGIYMPGRAMSALPADRFGSAYSYISECKRRCDAALRISYERRPCSVSQSDHSQWNRAKRRTQHFVSAFGR